MCFSGSSLLGFHQTHLVKLCWSKVLLRNGANAQGLTNKGQLAVELCSASWRIKSRKVRGQFCSMLSLGKLN